MIKVLVVFGTRPEAIKMAPLVLSLLKRKETFETKVCVTGQHREMLDQVLDFFEITPDFDLNLMKPNQNLYELTSDILLQMKPILEQTKPEYIMVHGDTSTTMASSLAGFYSGAKICHVEAGLRTYNLQSPFPEEMNRQVTSKITSLHFAPTSLAKENLIQENINESKIFITGNTVIDALLWAKEKVNTNSYQNKEIETLKQQINFNKKVILITGHRRENKGKAFDSICQSLKNLAHDFNEVEIVYPVHLNPIIQNVTKKHLKNIKNIHLISPLSYPSFVWLMEQSYFIITDSGGIQEEAPSLGKPVLLTRDTTERPEAIRTGTVIMVGTDKSNIYNKAKKLLTNTAYYQTFSKIKNPYGDGTASEKIIEGLLSII